MCWSGLTWPWHFISGFTSSLVHPWSTHKVRWKAWLLRLCRIFLLDGWILIPDIRRGPTRIHCLERSNESWICRSCSLRASRKRIDLPEPEGSICNETGEFAKIIITDASQCWYLHRTILQFCPAKNPLWKLLGILRQILQKLCYKQGLWTPQQCNRSFCANGSMLHTQCGHGHQSNISTKSDKYNAIQLFYTFLLDWK